MRTRMVGGKSVPLTQAEEDARDTEEAESAVNKANGDRIKKRRKLIANELDQAARASIAGQIAAIEVMNDAALDAALGRI